MTLLHAYLAEIILLYLFLIIQSEEELTNNPTKNQNHN